MAQISITLTDDIEIRPWTSDNPNIMAITISTWHGKEDFYAGRQSRPHLSTDNLNLHGTREQIKAFALKLLKQTTGEQWITSQHSEMADWVAALESLALQLPQGIENGALIHCTGVTFTVERQSLTRFSQGSPNGEPPQAESSSTNTVSDVEVG